MNIILVVEKPSISRVIAVSARNYWPDASIVFVHANPARNFRFKYPHGLAWASYPILSVPVWRIMPWEDWVPKKADEIGNLTPVEMTDEVFCTADEIVWACDPDHTGAVVFDTLVRHHFGETSRKFHALIWRSFTESYIQKSFQEIGDYSTDCSGWLQYGLAKRYFDWNWNINAQALFGRVFQILKIPSTAPVISKYSLQLLYKLREIGDELSEGGVLKLMNNWEGTGRYKNDAQSGLNHVSLGSAMSMASIINNLAEAGLIERREAESRPRILNCISPTGRDFLAQLHPGCFDPDLPFRLNEWCNAGLSECQPAMDKYLKTFFGKQKRLLASK